MTQTKGGDSVSSKDTYQSNSSNPLTNSTEKFGFHEEGKDYNPFEHRNVPHPTSDLDTLVHLLKGSLGSGILAMPLAIRNAGLTFGIVATLIVGFICTYCVHILVKCAHILCERTKTPSLSFAEVAETAFTSGPVKFRKFSRLARGLINTFLVLDLIGCCCVYNVFVGENIKQVVDSVTGNNWDIKVYVGMLAPFLVLLNLIRNLKYLAPCSLLANILMSIGLGITFYYMFRDLPNPADRDQFSSLQQLPLFFGTAIFALEGIGVVMPLENNMKTPGNFIKFPGILHIGMTVVVSLYAAVGFCGYLKYGNDIKGSITLNLPNCDNLARSVKVMIAVAIFLTYGLQFYVPMEIIWNSLKQRLEKYKLAEYILRILIVLGTVGVAIAVPKLGPIISLVGAVCLSTLGMMFPAIIELITYHDEPGYGRGKWILWKNIFIILFGILGFVTGTMTSIQDIIKVDNEISNSTSVQEIC